jgi:hypothetical protein
VGWFCRGLWVSLCFWVFRVFFLSPYLTKKKDAVIKATGSKASELAGSDFDDL